MIDFQDLTYTYPGAASPALSGVTVHIPPGKITLVTGYSGSGKSTLLRCINGLVPHFSGGELRGRLRVGEMDPVISTPQMMSRHVGFVFQDPESQFVVDQVEDEIAFSLENAAVPPRVMRERVDEVLRLLSLEHLRKRRLETLSGGERQRVAIAAALALQPSILVLDEPTSQLDPQSAEEVFQSLTCLNQELGLTIILAEHRLERVLPFTDHLIYLKSGGCGVLAGPPRQVLEEMDLIPPLITVSKMFGWRPIPLTVEEGRKYAVYSMQWAVGRGQGVVDSRQGAGGNGQGAGGNGQGALGREQRVGGRGQSYSQPYIKAEGLVVEYNHRPVLKNVSLAVYPGEILALMGHNGAGKTTLLRAMVGLIRPQQGSIRVAGNDIANQNIAEICSRVGYLPQDPNALLFADTVLDEFLTTLRNHQLPIDSTPDELLKRLGLYELQQRYPRDLSVGQRQRVALGAVTVTHPGATLLDEPTRGLDYAAKQALVQILQDWRAENMAILLVTHDVELAAACADRVALLEDGQIVADGDPHDILLKSPTFTPQVALLFPDLGWLTPADVCVGEASAQVLVVT